MEAAHIDSAPVMAEDLNMAQAFDQKGKLMGNPEAGETLKAAFIKCLIRNPKASSILSSKVETIAQPEPN